MSNKIHVIASFYGQGFGGGESFLEDSMNWAKELGFKTYWISFSHVKTGIYNQLEIKTNEHGTMIHLPGGFNSQNLRNWIKLLKPTFMHTQGRNRKEILDVAESLRIPILNGYHFWNGLIDLNPHTFNTDIYNHLSNHKKSKEIDLVLKNKYSISYVCSGFMKDITKEICNIDFPIIYAASSASSSSSKELTNVNIGSHKIKTKKFVTQINIHKLKGGDIFYNLVSNTKLPYIAIQSEPGSEELDKKIFDVISKRKNSVYFNHTKNIKDIYFATKILLVPSLVDETFCRVVNEGLMNGIPIVTTGAGNIKYLVGDAALVLPNDPNLWKEEVKKLYFDDEVLEKYSQKSLLQYSLFSEKIARTQFSTLIQSSLLRPINKDNNLMILVPFVSQGLGNQGKHYANILKGKFNISIFSYLPYNALDEKDLQKDPSEWNHGKYDVYYSKNTRENISDLEIQEFVSVKNIGKCIIPETCWKRIFEIGNLLKSLGVKTYAIPNIEIVRKDEIYKHRIFDKILCNNKLCENNFRKFGFNNLETIFYSIEPDVHTTDNEKITFLCVSGMNSISRKQAEKVCESFVKAYEKSNNIQLILTVQKFYDPILDQYKKYDFITIINEFLSEKELDVLYKRADVCIQVSKKEGLGLGFFESISRGVPVITLDTSPHNEIIINEVNGWLCKCDHKPMIDNPQSLMDDAMVIIDELTKKVIYVSQIDKSKLSIVKKNTVTDYEKRFPIQKFISNLVLSIN